MANLSVSVIFLMAPDFRRAIIDDHDLANASNARQSGHRANAGCT
jgi:hypothetical protein